ncbi:MAG: nucleoside recognition domain-containing protein [Clostridia bacterium]|nr:nucleoside recognition domain-containing protein [Clostridia bacterium]
MLNYLWGAMIFIGIVVAAFTGRMADVTNGAIDSAKEAVSLAITMLGVMSMWTGIMKIGEKAGLIKSMSKKMMPFLHWLFPDVPKEHKAMEYISTNVIANILGLGWAATPAGISAMKELQKLNRDKTTASIPMCMFMIFNMSSLQLVSINIIAYRSQYNSQNPSEIIGPGIVTTLISTVAAIIFAKIMEVKK